VVSSISDAARITGDLHIARIEAPQHGPPLCSFCAP
jgi:hypothetical protein